MIELKSICWRYRYQFKCCKVYPWMVYQPIYVVYCGWHNSLELYIIDGGQTCYFFQRLFARGLFWGKMSTNRAAVSAKFNSGEKSLYHSKFLKVKILFSNLILFQKSNLLLKYCTITTPWIVRIRTVYHIPLQRNPVFQQPYIEKYWRVNGLAKESKWLFKKPNPLVTLTPRTYTECGQPTNGKGVAISQPMEKKRGQQVSTAKILFY